MRVCIDIDNSIDNLNISNSVTDIVDDFANNFDC